MNQIIKATCVIFGATPAIPVESFVVLFDGFPSTSDLQTAVQADEKWVGLVETCEVSSIEDYKDDLEVDGVLQFDCLNEGDKRIGAIVIEPVELFSSSLAVVE